ncbi:recombinase family protein [Deinococcus sp. QL22]|uniref:recombinase family protein n=1 Tax=Deinococcus sp. QL22 TaxID=2939437 RepID=UPI0020180D74|nr:recombinase family protein [Deinococcus sp. QL22]UQN08676.1 recombinase family protein [Deinococcus sp. QL22]
MLIGYVRSGHVLDSPFPQAARLIAAGCQALFVEISGGDHLSRPVLHRTIDLLRSGDVLVVEDLDRLSSNPLHLKIVLRRLEERHASLNVLSFEDELVLVRGSATRSPPP